MIYDNTLTNLAGQSNSYTKTEIRALIETQYTFDAPLTRTVDRATGICTLGLSSNTPITNTFTTRIDIQPPSQYGGSIRIIPALNTVEASIGYYHYIDTRWASAGDPWACGVNCDNERGYTITTPVLNTWFNIGLNGNVSIPYGSTLPGIATNTIKGSTSPYLTLATDVVISFNATINNNCTINGHSITRGFVYDYSPRAE